MDEDERLIVKSWANDHGIQLSAQQLELLDIYLNEVSEWNKHINLTGVSSRHRIIDELLLDSLMPASFLPQKGRLLDLGSGGGFPAIPLKICIPGLKFHLVESNRKKVNFLKHVIRITRLENIEVLWGRIEEERGQLRTDGYNAVTARAVADLPRTIAWCAPHLIAGGLFVNFQGNCFESAVQKSADILEKEHIALFKSIPYRLPGKKGSERNLLVFIKNN
ncbi:MAG: 16S rRNA (guanine(527)-N(7))-methyltransferase RsmG [Deltaproteobacteria bacterium]|nr:16S rRNA (guanine(527)-N(7))-methyltransferase RsmG [Deltaproteobacteria bacterium]